MPTENVLNGYQTGAVNSNLAVLKNNPFQAPTYRYPLDLGEAGQEPYIIFEFHDSVAKGGKALGTVALYLPPQLKTSYRLAYDEPALGITKSMKMMETVWNDIQSIWNGNLRGPLSHAEEAAARIAAIALDAKTQLNAEVVIDMLQGKTANPHQVVVFRNVGFRTFRFEFVFMPRNERESEEVRKIIYRFKYAAHPSTTSPAGDTKTRWWYYPENVVVGLMSPADNQLFKISVCAITNIDVDYAGSDTPSFFVRSGAPVDVRMSIELKEMEQLSTERIKEGY